MRRFSAENLTLPKHVTIVEVGPRDGLQNEHAVSTDSKVALINALSQTGLTRIEVGAFVSAKRVPQMADSLAVFEQIHRSLGVQYSALTPNLQGFQAAVSAQVDHVAVFASCSEGFSQHNIHCSIAESLERFQPVMTQAKQLNIPVRGYLSTVIDCPYDGATPPSQVASIASALYQLGCFEISLGDTIGTGTPRKVATMLDTVMKRVPCEHLAVHFHDTYGQAIANIYQSMLMGINTIDSSVAGLGGCPYAPGASGNVASEDVVYLCQGLGIETGVDLDLLIQTGWQISRQLNKQPNSKVSFARKP
ncbi:TPA: hydroxymethylglutaryl-CoA lyase [Vibrio vulnificus]|nr:hydroxymethylglutaryl-CoA lyase [Vibrio vulnificus]ELV8663766.1 hydroxymethylglutaryl-CoA lyase [Vibrio vulnificus]HAS6263996.1 hydroxymethylglutaryl-CoA lyase [Vibrio vulnificus]HDY7644933.1 hydroxymethylglutaryl-CoA lyase [Vibrio vulnificus]